MRSRCRGIRRRAGLVVAIGLALPLLATDAGAGVVDVRESQWQLDGRVIAKVRSEGKLKEDASADFFFGPESVTVFGNQYELTLFTSASTLFFTGPYSIDNRSKVQIDIPNNQLETEILAVFLEIFGPLDPEQSAEVSILGQTEKIKTRSGKTDAPDDDVMIVRLKVKGTVTISEDDEDDIVRKFKVRFDLRGGRVPPVTP